MSYHPAHSSEASRANRRRLRVFLRVFVVACVLNLGYTFLRPAEYRAMAVLEITPGAEAPRPIETVTGEPVEQGQESAKPFLTEVQVLTSRPVLEATISRLRSAGEDLSSLGADPVARAQSMLQASVVGGTNVVEMTAVGKPPGFLASLLNTAVAAYQDHLAATAQESVTRVMAGAEEEVQKLEQNVATKRSEVEAFRVEHEIVSLEREENQILARVRGAATSLNTANERVAEAEGRLRSINQAIAAGKVAARSRDDPTLANLEQRASVLREDLGDLERNFTPDYMARDPDIAAKRVRLAELERQIDAQRKLNAGAALLEAREELASAQEMAARIRQQEAADRGEVQKFTASFNEYKALEGELTELETLYRAAAQRKVRLEASERARMPSVRVLETAAPPLRTWRPHYLRDAAMSVAASFLLALLAIWFVELFNRPEQHPALVIAQAGPVFGYAPQPALPPGAPHRLIDAGERPLLAPGYQFPRELTTDEVAALLEVGSGAERLGMLLMLSGAGAEETLALQCDDVDLDERTITIRGEPRRRVPMGALLLEALSARELRPGTPVLVDETGLGLTMDALNAGILCAAHDAGIGDAGAVTPAALRHTLIAFLVRQGVRFADLTQLVGRLPAEVLAAYSSLSPGGSRVGLASIEPMLPALRG